MIPTISDPGRAFADAEAAEAATASTGAAPATGAGGGPDALPDLFDPTTSNEPTVEREEGAKPARQDTPTEMFLPATHGGGPPAAPGTGATAPAPAAKAEPVRPLPPRPSVDDDNPTGVLDLEALSEASRRKAAALAGPPTAPPPPMDGSPAGLPPLGAPRGPSLGGGSDTMRLDVESLSGPMAIPALSPAEQARVADLPPAAPPAAFDPGRISLVDSPSAPGGPPGGQLPAPASAPLPHFLPPAAKDAAAAPPPSRPKWQAEVDRGISSIAAESREASARFGGWFRGLRQNEQMAFVAGAILGFLIVVMLFVYVVT